MRKATFPPEHAIPPGMAELMMIHGHPYVLINAYCSCRLWQVPAGYGMGRCGWCDERVVEGTP